MSDCLLDLITHHDNLPILCGDIGNAFITADCLEKIYSRAGPEFEDREGSIMVFKKALYGLCSKRLYMVFAHQAVRFEDISLTFYVPWVSSPVVTIATFGCENERRKTDMISTFVPMWTTLRLSRKIRNGGKL